MLAAVGDLQDAKHCREVIKKAVDGLGGIDILVNNAAHRSLVQGHTGDISRTRNGRRPSEPTSIRCST